MCVCVGVCESQPPAVEGSEAVCVVLFWTALNFPKRFVSGCREIAEHGQELWWKCQSVFLFSYKKFRQMKKFKRGKESVCMGGSLGVKA